MNSECKNYPMKRILVNFSLYMRNKVIFNISCISKCMGFTQIWVAYLNSECNNYPMKEFQENFSISSISVIRSSYAKKGQCLILAVFQNVWDLHKFGLQICIQNAKITLWKNFGQNFSISSISLMRSAYAKEGQF